MILCFGSVGIDIQTTLSHPFTDHAAWLADSSTIDAGGAMLIASVAAARCGGKVALFGAAGVDWVDDTIMPTLRREGINGAGLVQYDGATDLCHIIVDAQNTMRTITSYTAMQHVRADQLPPHYYNARHMILLSSHLPESVRGAVIAQAKEHHVRVVYMHHGGDLDITLADLPDGSSIVAGHDEGTAEDIITCTLPHHGFAWFSGAFAACLQAGYTQDDAIAIAQDYCRSGDKTAYLYRDMPYLHDLDIRD